MVDVVSVTELQTHSLSGSVQTQLITDPGQRAVVKKNKKHGKWASCDLVSKLLRVVDLLQRDGVRGEAMTQFGKNDAVPQRLLQLRGGRKLLSETRLHPPEQKTTGQPEAPPSDALIRSGSGSAAH